MDDLLARLSRRAKMTSDAIYVVALLIVSLMVGTVGFAVLEGWSIAEALYTTIITITTVGYGDYSPQTEAGRTFATIFVVLAVGIAGYAVSSLAASVIKRQQSRKAYKIWERKMKRLDKLQDHIILCGGGTISSQVAREFHRAKTPFILVDSNESLLRWTILYMQEDFIQHQREQFRHLGFIPDDEADTEDFTLAELAEELGVLYLLEDPTEDKTLYKAGIERARGLVTVLDDDKDNLFVVLSARQLASRVKNLMLQIVSRLTEEKNRSKLTAAGADKIISLDLLMGFQIATNVLHPEIADFWQHTYQGDRLIRFAALHMSDHPDVIGQTVGQVKERHDNLVVAIKRNGQYLYTPALDTVLQTEDILITIVTVESS